MKQIPCFLMQLKRKSHSFGSLSKGELLAIPVH